MVSRKDEVLEIKSLTIELGIWLEAKEKTGVLPVDEDVYEQKYNRLQQLEEKTGFFFRGSPTRRGGTDDGKV